MKPSRREEILNTMLEIVNRVDLHLEKDIQERGNITYYSDFTFGNSGLGMENVYIVETPAKKENKVGDREGGSSIYEIYDKDSNLVATVSENGKIHFTAEYLEELRDSQGGYFKQLKLEDIDFELPEELDENDITMTSEEIKEHEENEKGMKREEKGRDKEGKVKDDKEKQNEEEQNKETDEEQKKEQIAENLGIDASEIKSVSTINPREKITDKYNLIDIMPEAGEYDEVSIVYSGTNDKSNGRFTMMGISKDSKSSNIEATALSSIEPVEGTSTGKDVISVNQDGTEVTEKQVQGLFRINSRERTDGISVSVGSYGMMDIDYVSNVMDKEHRRATPIRTKGPENVRIPTAGVRENAGDSKEEVEKEGRIFRAREEKGINPQSLDGIDIDQADGGEMTLEQLKEHITEKTLEQGEMSKDETREFIESEISQSGLELSEKEVEYTTNEIEGRVIDESRFETKQR